MRSDPLLLERILRNLLSNALRYTRRGSILLGARRHGRALHLMVCDTGPGIPPDKREAVFEEFCKLDAGGEGGGLGLGLAIVQRMVRLLGHRIQVRSELGRGSIFIVEVPLARATCRMGSGTPSHEDRAPGVPEAGTLVVVIEDDPIQVMALRMTLENWRCRVITAPSAEQALAALAEEGGQIPDLVLSDLRLGNETDGIEVVKRLRAAMGHGIPAILITGETGPAYLEAAHKAGLSLLTKPFTPCELRSAVVQALGG